MPTEFLLLYRIFFFLAILGFLLFHMKLSTVLSRSVKNFAAHCIESVDCFIFDFSRQGFSVAKELVL